MAASRAGVIARLGVAQTLAWGSSYYLPAVLAAPMARDTGVSTSTVFLAFSAALVVSAALGPAAGDAIDRIGGRPVLMATNGVFALSLVTMALAQGPIGLFCAWALLGIGMASGLYEAAFAALVRLYGQDSRNAITGITLIAGFASTVGWPISAWLESHHGWRVACLGWAVLHLTVALPLNASLPRATALPPVPPRDASAPILDTAMSRSKLRAAMLLSFVFAVTWFVSTAMAAHLPRLLQAGGVTLAVAVALGSLVGPAQVIGRIAEFGFLRRAHPLLSARLAAIMHPLGAVAFIVLGGPMAALFTCLHGVGNGILTIAKGTLPLALFGSDGYGRQQGILMVPARIAQAAAPWTFGLLLDRYGAGALWLSTGLCLASFLSLLALRAPVVASP